MSWLRGITHADWHQSNKSVSYEHAWIGIRSVIPPTPTFGCSWEVAGGGIRVSEWVAPFVFSTKWNQLRRSTKSKAGERGSNERTTEEEETAAAMNELLFGIGGGSDKSKVSRWASGLESRIPAGLVSLSFDFL